MAAIKAQGIECPFIREGDDLIKIVVDSIANRDIQFSLKDKDIIGITESVVARAYGKYITVDDIAESVSSIFGKNEHIILVNPIYSRNRFSMILRGIARAASSITIVMPSFDEVGNPSGINPFTGIDIKKYYEEICKEEQCLSTFVEDTKEAFRCDNLKVLYCGLHDFQNYCIPYQSSNDIVCTLADICKDVSPDFGVLGTNKADGERLKLYPSKELCKEVCKSVQQRIKECFNVNAIVCIYGDGCFKDPVGGIWEFADPITMPGYTNSEYIENTPNEVKLKFVIDEGLTDDEIKDVIRKHKNVDRDKTRNVSLGTTPRICRDLIASLMDLISGSGDRKTPVVLIQDYFD